VEKGFDDRGKENLIEEILGTISFGCFWMVKKKVGKAKT
jgi:hypothetical protein